MHEAAVEHAAINWQLISPFHCKDNDFNFIEMLWDATSRTIGHGRSWPWSIEKDENKSGKKSTFSCSNYN
jgi:hypothetical protein